ncbi:MAG: hypothetical protein JO362_02950 [Streptomycetaceae bacterium]|nr:hypothetical protein [Streptomycetaceae bacterium]
MHTSRRDGDGIGGLLDGSATFEELRQKAIDLRREGLSRRQIRDQLKVGNNDLLNRLLEGEPPPEWTKRPNAKDHLRLKARELRAGGMTYDEIRAELGVSKSSISAWVRDPPKPAPHWTRVERMQRMHDGMVEFRRLQDVAREQLTREAKSEIGDVSDRDLMMAGVALYWAEGQKDKPYARRECISFINSDPNVIRLFVRWLEMLGVGRDRLRCTLNIHSTADVEEATRFWAELVGIPSGDFRKPGIKQDNPGTHRMNRGAEYHGCLTVYVKHSAELYRRVEGWWYGIVVGASRAA